MNRGLSHVAGRKAYAKSGLLSASDVDLSSFMMRPSFARSFSWKCSFRGAGKGGACRKRATTGRRLPVKPSGRLGFQKATKWSKTPVDYHELGLQTALSKLRETRQTEA